MIAWTGKALTEQRTAQVELAALPADRTTDPGQIRELLRALGDIPALLAAAHPVDKAERYGLLAVGLVWDPTTRTATAEAGVGAASQPTALHTTGGAGHVGDQSVRGGT